MIKSFIGVDKTGDWYNFKWEIKINSKYSTEYRLGLGHCTTKMPSNKKMYKSIVKSQISEAHLIEILKAKKNSRVSSWDAEQVRMLWVKIPTVKEILYALATDASLAEGTFKDFCDNLGYDSDSRKALDIYLRCQETHNMLRMLKLDTQRILDWEL